MTASDAAETMIGMVPQILVVAIVVAVVLAGLVIYSKHNKKVS